MKVNNLYFQVIKCMCVCIYLYLYIYIYIKDYLTVKYIPIRTSHGTRVVSPHHEHGSVKGTRSPSHERPAHARARPALSHGSTI